ncbi:hypothetical protein FQN60_002144 [Etheostoma spectabile]|uniref:protein kinase C n=1 Tax=Etheostoma spectabile TaxID=54343 RepID=A0A5J5DDU7_9PERO|nr:hypothetical protein FQN60_002144 [Etheostoma spectabile]
MKDLRKGRSRERRRKTKGEESIYRRGARRWRKLYRVNGHLFQAKRFNRIPANAVPMQNAQSLLLILQLFPPFKEKAYCGHCSERIWGLGRQGYKCINCKLLVHKRCHRLIPQTCQRLMDPVMPSQEPPSDAKSEEVDLPPDDTEDTDGISFLPHNCSLDKTEDAETEDIKAVVDGIDGIKLSQDLALGLGDFDLIRVIGRGSYAKDIDWVQTEKHVFEQASTNPFLVGLHSCFQTESRLFLVIEYVNGGDLMFHMQRQRKLPEEHARTKWSYCSFSVDWWALGVLMFEMMAGRSPFDIITDNPDMNTEEYLFQVILEKPIRIPRSLSVKAASVLKGFLNKDPKERLGCQVQTGFTDLKAHTFFRSIDWEQLDKKEMTPPFKPQITDDYGLENFDTQFTNEPVQLTPDDEDVIKRIDQSEFEGFEYINPLLLTTEESV